MISSPPFWATKRWTALLALPKTRKC